jgi:hypothetical protein
MFAPKLSTFSAILLGLLLRESISYAMPLDLRGKYSLVLSLFLQFDLTPNQYSFPCLTILDPGCDAICQHNRHNPPKAHGPGTIYFQDWSNPTETCSDGVCSSNDNAIPLIALDGEGFNPNQYAQFTVWWHGSNKEIWSALAPIDNLGYTGVETPLRDCSSYPDATKNNAYARAYDSAAGAWSKPIDLSAGCKDTIL